MTVATDARKTSRKPRVSKRTATHYSTDQDRALTMIARTGSVAVDLETTALHPHEREGAQIGAVILRSGGERFIFRELPDWWPEVWADRDTRKVGSNLKFDGIWMIDAQMPVYGRNIQDLMLKSQISHRYRTFDGVKKAFPKKMYPTVNSREMWEPNDLAHIIEENLGVKIKKGDEDNPYKIYHTDQWRYEESWEKDDKGKRHKVKTLVELLHKGVDWSGPWTHEMEEYMLEDIDYLEETNTVLDKRIQDSGQERVSWIENNTVFATSWMTYNGITPDVEAWHDHIAEQGEQHKHLIWHLKKFFPDIKNFNSPVQISQALSTYTGSPIRSVKKQIIKQLAPYYPGIAILQDQRKLQTRLKNWGSRFLKDHVCGMCGRFHPDWRQIGAETARFSCSKPNVQQIPREADYRKLFVAMENHKLVSLDYSAIEVVTAAVFAKCPNLLEACATGDPHLATARLTSGDPTLPKSDPRRQNAKIVNFGLLFGGGAAGLVVQARDLFDVVMSEDQARSMIQEYYGLYPELRYSKNWAYRAMEVDGPVEVRTLVGFMRILEGMNRKPTSWLNTIIQSSAGHGIKSGVRYLMEAGLLPFLCMQVHDEFLFEFPDVDPVTGETAEERAEIAKDCMIRGMQEVLGILAPVRVDVAAGGIWL